MKRCGQGKTKKREKKNVQATSQPKLYNTDYNFPIFMSHDASPQKLRLSKCYLTLHSNLSRRANSQNLTSPYNHSGKIAVPGK